MATIYPTKLPIDGANIDDVDGNNLDSDNQIALDKTGASTFESSAVIFLTLRTKAGTSDTKVFVAHPSDYEDPRTRVLESNAIDQIISPGDQLSVLLSKYLTPAHVDLKNDIVKVDFNSASDADRIRLWAAALRPSDMAAAGIG